jgi:DNA-binding NtrC family response regulator
MTQTMKGGRVLVVDDKESFAKLVQRILGEQHEVSIAGDGAQALALLGGEPFDVVVSDIRMPGADGLTLLAEARRAHPDTEVILMTAFGSVQDAVAAMRQGAFDYVLKPFEPEEISLVVERALERKRLRDEARDLRRAVAGAYHFDNMIARSPAMVRVLELMRRAADSEATVLITGESGTGKEVVARAIHMGGARRAGRFVAVNCGALPEPLIESELFGHMRGSFTGAVGDKRGLFEEAARGTLFLDEIGELPAGVQVKLNRALQEHAVRRVGGSEERKVDVRVIAATRVDLREASQAGRFREDLFYRLNVFPIHLPPLRDRREDIPPLAAHFLARHGGGHTFAPESLAALVNHDWPGNVRELENAVERAIAVADGPRLGLAQLPDEVAHAARPRITAPDDQALTYKEVVDLARDRASREYLSALLRELGGNVTEAARRAGMERESLHRLLRRYGIRSESFKR